MMIAYLLVLALFALVGVAALLAVYRSRQLAFMLQHGLPPAAGGSSLVLLAGSFSTTLLSCSACPHSPSSSAPASRSCSC